MKILLILLLQFPVIFSQLEQASTTGPIYFGKTDNFKLYEDQVGFYVDIDYSELNLSRPPLVHAYLSCNGNGCWTTYGASSIYNLSRKGFRLYLI